MIPFITYMLPKINTVEEVIRCPFCLDGEWFRNKEFKEPYGYPYRAASIKCGVCHGSKAILKSEVDKHPDLEQVKR